jgi:hypothetical protein
VVVFDLRLCPRLADEPRLRLGVGGPLRQHHFECHLPLQRRVFGPEHDAHAALAEQGEDAVRAEPAEVTGPVRRTEEWEHRLDRPGNRPGGR